MALSLEEVTKAKRKRRQLKESPGAREGSVGEEKVSSQAKASKPRKKRTTQKATSLRPWDSPLPSTKASTPIQQAEETSLEAPQAPLSLKLRSVHGLSNYFLAMVKMNRQRLSQGKRPSLLLPFHYGQKK